MAVQNANCKALYGISTVCGDNLFPGGADKDFYVGYVSDLSTSISLTQTGVISGLSFAGYNGLVKFSGNKFAHTFSWPWAKGAGGNGFFQHRAVVKLLPLSVQDDVEVQRLLQAQDAFIIYRNNNDKFFIMGASKGMTSVAGDLGTTGTAAGDDVTDTVTLEGAEKTKPLRFEVTDLATTILYLDNRVI
jgi:hypothetical protein